MLKRKRIKVGIAAMALIILTSSMAAFAQSYTDVYVFGSQYTVAADGESENTANYVVVVLTDIYKADGTSSNYSKVKGDVVNTSGDQISTKTDCPITVQETTTIMLSHVFARGTKMKLRLKGNNSTLDCIVNFSASIS